MRILEYRYDFLLNQKVLSRACFAFLPWSNPVSHRAFSYLEHGLDVSLSTTVETVVGDHYLRL